MRLIALAAGAAVAGLAQGDASFRPAEAPDTEAPAVLAEQLTLGEARDVKNDSLIDEPASRSSGPAVTEVPTEVPAQGKLAALSKAEQATMEQDKQQAEDETCAAGGGSCDGQTRKTAEPTPCSRPEGWCDETQGTYAEVDCDFDGIADPFCADAEFWQTGFLGSSNGCEDTWPVGGCGGSCIRDVLWCAAQYERFALVDCDGDGIPDPYCESIEGRGFLSSVQGCKDTWPDGVCNPQLVPTACERPEGWCNSSELHGSIFYYEIDCDNDGIKDPFCSDNEGFQTGFLGSSNNCADTWPSGGCGGSCLRPSYWCSAPYERWMYKDCDFDGIPDPYCENEEGSGYLSSAHGCEDTWPNGVCKERGMALACARPHWWCTEDGAIYSERDCDGDGVPDPHCSHNASSGFLASANECLDTWPTGGCNGTCRKPDGWCGGAHHTYSERDCDDDGIADPHCEGYEGSGFISSYNGCLVTWPWGGCMEPAPPGSCRRPRHWCLGAEDTFSFTDCDFDGIPDPSCEKSKGADRGFISSSRSCLDTWPSRGCNSSCVRPVAWCTNTGDVFTLWDCDDDGILDPFCRHPSHQSEFISSVEGCAPPKDPKRWRCGCPRTKGWCVSANETFAFEDVDTDGQRDAVCYGDGKEYPRALVSTVRCMEFRVHGGPCIRPATWCEDLGARTGWKQDCDGDGIEDLICAGGTRARNAFYVSSAHSCHVIPVLGGCRPLWGIPRQLLSYMDCVSPDGECERPGDFCPLDSQNYSLFDADGDGIRDHTCVWTGFFGIPRCAYVSSRFGCITVWLGNCTNVSHNLSEIFLGNDPIKRAGYQWLGTEKFIRCSMRWVGIRSVDRHGGVPWRISLVRVVATAILLVTWQWWPLRFLLRRLESWRGEYRGMGPGQWAVQAVLFAHSGWLALWALGCVPFDGATWRTQLFASGLRDSLDMLEAKPGSAIVQDMAVLVPWLVGIMAVELLMAPLSPVRRIHCVMRLVFWPAFLQRNWAPRFTALQLGAELAPSLQELGSLIAHSRPRVSWALRNSVSTAVLLVVGLMPALAVLRSLWLLPPHAHLWARDEGYAPLEGQELLFLNLGCVLPPLLSVLEVLLWLRPRWRWLVRQPGPAD